MRIEIVGDPAEKIFDMLRSSGKISNLKYYSGKIDIFLGGETKRETVAKIKNSVIETLSGAVKKYMMRVIN